MELKDIQKFIYITFALHNILSFLKNFILLALAKNKKR